MKDIFKPIIVLTLICLVITSAVAGVNMLTKDAIAEIDKATAEATMGELIPNAEFEDALFDKAECSEIYKASANGETVGYIFTSSAFGYGGQVRVMTAIGADGKVIGVRVLACNDETPGLGQNAKNESFTDRFIGAVSKQEVDSADAITSATLTSNAVKKSVNAALADFNTIMGGAVE